MLSTEDLNGHGKLMSKYIGPFRVVSVLPDKMVELELPVSMKRKHPRFNVSKVKMFKTSDIEFPERKQLDRPPPVFEDGEEKYYDVESILGKRKVRVKKSKRYVTEYLVKWLGYDMSEATWQSEADLDAPPVKEEIEKFEQLQLG
jgi:hypothetical protein